MIWFVFNVSFQYKTCFNPYKGRFIWGSNFFYPGIDIVFNIIRFKFIAAKVTKTESGK